MNVEELLQKHKIYYRTSGEDFLIKCLNPEHDDSNPSMRVNSIMGVFNCFSCGFKGNIFAAYKEDSDKLSIIRTGLKKKLTKLADYPALELPESAIMYTDSYRGISALTIRAHNAFTTRDLDLKNRLIFPLTNRKDEIYAFIGRDMYGTEKHKYLFYPRSVMISMFPSKPILKNGELIIVEGIFDYLNLVDNGVSNVACIFGVNTLSAETLETLQMAGLSKLIIILDSDDAGRKGAKKIEESCKELFIPCVNVVLQDSKDPGDLTRDQILNLRLKLNV